MTSGSSHEHGQAYPLEMRGYLATMEELMNNPAHNNSVTPTQLAVDLWQDGSIGSFAQFEACLRDIGSKVHFIAVPLDTYGPEYVTAYPVDGLGEPEYTLFAAVNGEQEAAQLLDHFGITQDENVARLAKTGLLALAEKP